MKMRNLLKWLAAGTVLGNLTTFTGVGSLAGSFIGSPSELGTWKDLEEEFQDRPLPVKVLELFDQAVQAHQSNNYFEALRLYNQLTAAEWKKFLWVKRYINLHKESSVVTHNLYLLCIVLEDEETADEYRVRRDKLIERRR